MIPVEQKIAVVVAPVAAEQLLESAHRAGDDNWVAVNLVVGNPTGVRVEAFPFSSKYLKVGVEALGGVQQLSEAGGGGVRLQIRVLASRKNALYISPGVDVYFSPPTAQLFGHYGTVYYASADVDVSWLHEFAHHFGFEVGIKAGGEVGWGLPAYESLSGTAILPEVSLFTGVRF